MATSLPRRFGQRRHSQRNSYPYPAQRASQLGPRLRVGAFSHGALPCGPPAFELEDKNLSVGLVSDAGGRDFSHRLERGIGPHQAEDLRLPPERGDGAGILRSELLQEEPLSVSQMDLEVLPGCSLSRR